MIRTLDETHDTKAASWVESANLAGADFPIQNLPFGVFRARDVERQGIGIAIGSSVFDLGAATAAGSLQRLNESTATACRANSLNELMSLGVQSRRQLRRELFRLLHVEVDAPVRETAGRFLLPMLAVEMQIPAHIGDYTDFYAFISHATNVGRMFRPDNPLLPNYKWVPIGYHGRSSSIVISGTEISRPRGQTVVEKAETPVFRRSGALDYELEIGAYVATGNSLGHAIPIENAEEHIFGISIVNDWSARDIQSWEYQPLGPFLSKSFATSVSPWVITMEALAPYRCASVSRPATDPQPMAHLESESNRERGAIELTVEASLSSAKMREQKIAPIRLSQGSFREMYWTFAQLFAHHSSNGCNLRPGDLLASGTISGDTPDSRGCMLELTQRGKQKLKLPTGEERGFLEDGDEVILRGWCDAPNAARIGLGECRGQIRG